MAIRERILIIGNGFDLYHELPTRYSQFIAVLKNMESLEIDGKSSVTFNELFKDVDRFSEMKVRFDTEKMVFDNNKILEIKKTLQNNKWYKSFKSKTEFEHWIDVENEIKNCLKEFNYIIKKINDVLNKNNNLKMLIFGNQNSGSGFGGQEPTYISINEQCIKYIFEFALNSKDSTYQLDEEYFTKINNRIIKFKADYFFEELFMDLKEFIEIFNFYLSEIVDSFYDEIDTHYLNDLENIKSEISSFYTFNYTSSLEKLYAIDTKKINYLHGKHKKENNNIVLGIDEIDIELQNDKIYMFTKYYQKLFNDTDYQFLIEMQPQNSFDYSEKDFILFGHSLADNDQNYLIDLFEIVKLRDKSTITILYHTINDKAQKLKNLLKIVGRKDIEFLMKKKRLIFIPINDKPFETVFKSLPESYSDSIEISIF